MAGDKKSSAITSALVVSPFKMIWCNFFFPFQVGQFLSLVATFIAGFVVAFTKGWLLTLVMLSIIPLIALSGAIMSKVISKASSIGQAAYSTAANVVEQTLGSIRTVCTLAE